jgi:Protein of unknown function (DUF3431)
MCRPQTLWRDVLAGYIAGDATAPPPGQVSAPCCGEFSVAAAQVAAHPRQLYADLLAWAAKPATLDGDRCPEIAVVNPDFLHVMCTLTNLLTGQKVDDLQWQQVCLLKTAWRLSFGCFKVSDASSTVQGTGNRFACASELSLMAHESAVCVARRYHEGRAFEYLWHLIFGEPPVAKAVPHCSLYVCER